MGRRKKKSSAAGDQKLRKTVFCPMCENMMKFAKTKPHQISYNKQQGGPEYDAKTGKVIMVTRKFYYCPSCETVAWFDYREDGERGKLHMQLEFEEKTGLKPHMLDGKKDKLII